MARLAGEFTILMLVTFDVTTARKAEQLRNSLLQIEGLQVNTRWVSDEQLKQGRPSPKFRKILLRGVDNPGLVYNLTEYLSSHGVNIESLVTYNQEATTPGAKLFMMEGVIAMPVGLSIAAFIHNLDTLQATLGAEIKISDLPNPVHDKLSSPFEESS
jgi:glycine cleavage system regulatory protein